mgnify:CR=1 FL=1
MVFNLVETIAGKGNLIHLFPALLDALKQRKPGPTIIYVTLQRTAETLADRILAGPAAPRHPVWASSGR